MIIVKKDRNENKKLEEFVLNNVPNSSKVSEISSEATFLLPKESAQYFAEFFKKLDEELNRLDISSYGVSMTTLEEVFLKVEGGDKHKDAEMIEAIKRRSSAIEDK